MYAHKTYGRVAIPSHNEMFDTLQRGLHLRDKMVNVLLRQEMVAGPHRKVPHSDQLADEAGTPFPAPFFYSDLFHIPKFALR